MSNAVLDDNLRRLFVRCAPRLTADDVDRALARFGGRRRPAPAHSRRIAAAAAALLVAAVLGWLALPAPKPPAAVVPAQHAPEEIDRLIADLGVPEAREKAKGRLLEIGAPALAPLDRAIYHQDPEVRVQSQKVAALLRRAAEIRPKQDFVRAAVGIVRARWTARDFDNFDAAVHQAFEPEEVRSVRYVPRKSVGTMFASAGPGVDCLTPELVAALDAGDGILYINSRGETLDYGAICLFTLPDKVGWSAYVVVGGIQVTLEPVTILVAEGEAPLSAAATVAPRPGGGLRIVDLVPTSGMAKVLRKGDVLSAVDGKPVAAAGDLPAAHPGTLTIDRDGKVIHVAVRVLRRSVVEKKKEDAEIEAKTMFDQAAKWEDADPGRALEFYTELMKKYGSTRFLTPERKAYAEKQIAELKARTGQK